MGHQEEIFDESQFEGKPEMTMEEFSRIKKQERLQRNENSEKSVVIDEEDEI